MLIHLAVVTHRQGKIHTLTHTHIKEFPQVQKCDCSITSHVDVFCMVPAMGDVFCMVPAMVDVFCMVPAMGDVFCMVPAMWMCSVW